MFRLFTGCTNGLGLLSKGVCQGAEHYRKPPRLPRPAVARLPAPAPQPVSNSSCNQVCVCVGCGPGQRGEARKAVASRQRPLLPAFVRRLDGSAVWGQAAEEPQPLPLPPGAANPSSGAAFSHAGSTVPRSHLAPVVPVRYVGRRPACEGQGHHAAACFAAGHASLAALCMLDLLTEANCGF